MDEELDYYDDDDDIDDDGSDDEVVRMEVGAPAALERFFGRLGRMKRDPRKQVQQIAVTKFKPSLASAVHPKIVTTLKKMSRLSATVHKELGRIEANQLRRPNMLCGIYGTAMAPGASLAFQIQPSGGTSWYRLLGFLAGDDQAQIFGFSSLKVGGLDQIFATQTTPTPPVANAVAWVGFVARGDNQVFNLSPWTGNIFDTSVVVQGTIVNMSVAATGDAITLAPRFLIPCQTDPCGQNSASVKAAAAGFSANLRKALRSYA